MRNRIRLFYVTLAFAFLGATPAMAQNYLVSGQVHPQFRLEVAINGEVIKSVTPNPSKPKIFLTQIDPSIISDGQNSLTVSYDVVSEEEGGTAPVPSFKVRIVRQTDISDKNTATELLELRGPRMPYEGGQSGTLTDNF